MPINNFSAMELESTPFADARWLKWCRAPYLHN
jgi:hypothetical protein